MSTFDSDPSTDLSRRGFLQTSAFGVAWYAVGSPLEYPDDSKAIQKIADAVRAKHGLPALAVAVTNSKRLVGAVVSGTVSSASKRPLQLDHRFCIGSVTKSFASSVIATIVDDGKLSWDTKLADALPDMRKVMRKEYRQVTLEQLLSHTAGLVQPGAVGNVRQRTGVGFAELWRWRTQLVATVLSKPPVHEPGTKVKYSNMDLRVANAVAERATGVQWETMMKQRLLQPLGIKRHGYDAPATTADRDQPRHHHNGKVLRLAAPVTTGALNVSIPDFAKFARMHLRGLRGDKTMLSRRSIKKLHTPIQKAAGLGWFIKNGKHSHGGASRGYCALLTVWPKEDLAVVSAITTSGKNDVNRALHDQLVRRLAR